MVTGDSADRTTGWSQIFSKSSPLRRHVTMYVDIVFYARKENCNIVTFKCGTAEPCLVLITVGKVLDSSSCPAGQQHAAK